MKYWDNALQITVFLYIVTEILCEQGEWGPWGHWGKCSVTCGYGIQKREKVWNSPKPTRSKEKYTYEDIVECITNIPCPVDGNWSFWGPWSECTKMCGGGTTTRRRECNAPEAQYGGKECEGKEFVTTTCNEWECPPLPPNFDIRKCNESTFMCLSKQQCIMSTVVCDDVLQCHDGSDEHNCEYYHWTNGASRFSSYSLWLTFSSLLLTTSLYRHIHSS